MYRGLGKEEDPVIARCKVHKPAAVRGQAVLSAECQQQRPLPRCLQPCLSLHRIAAHGRLLQGCTAHNLALYTLQVTTEDSHRSWLGSSGLRAGTSVTDSSRSACSLTWAKRRRRTHLRIFGGHGCAPLRCKYAACNCTGYSLCWRAAVPTLFLLIHPVWGYVRVLPIAS